MAELACPHGHGFEGGFGPHAVFDAQLQQGLVHCPHCGSAQVERRLSAPRLNLGASEPAPVTEAAQLLREWVAVVLAGTEDMGRDFVQEARCIHQAQANAADRRAALQEEGIEAWALPLPGLADDARSH